MIFSGRDDAFAEITHSQKNNIQDFTTNNEMLQWWWWQMADILHILMFRKFTRSVSVLPDERENYNSAQIKERNALLAITNGKHHFNQSHSILNQKLDHKIKFQSFNWNEISSVSVYNARQIRFLKKLQIKPRQLGLAVATPFGNRPQSLCHRGHFCFICIQHFRKTESI